MGVQFAGNILVQSNGGPLPIASGGTGQTTAPTAINALLPVQTGQSGKILVTDGTNVSWSGVTMTPGGSDTMIQYNDSGSFGGNAFLVVNKSTGAVTSASTFTGTGAYISDAAATTRSLKFQTAGSDRWLMQANNTSESGSAAGSNFEFVRVADNGATTNQVFTASRQSGVIDFKATPTINGVAIGTGAGTVTSVAGTGTVSGLTLSGTVTTSGSLTLGGTLSVAASDFASQTANTFLSAPNGSAGVPTFRAIVAADIPTLNQSTTGNAATATALATPRAINGINFDGTAPITVTADANTLTGTTLHSTVVSSSLTSVGTLTSLNTTGPVTINNIGTVGTATLVTSTITADQVIDGIAISAYRAATYRISVTYGTDCQYSEVKMIHNTTNVYIGEINTILTGALLASFTADISSGIMRLLTTPVNAITTYKAVSILVAA